MGSRTRCRHGSMHSTRASVNGARRQTAREGCNPRPEATLMSQGILAQVSDIGAHLEEATARMERFKTSEVQKRMNFSSFQDFLFQEKDNEIAALKNDLKTHQAKEIAMRWETEDKIRMAVAEVEESEVTVSKLQAELKRFAVVIA